MTHKLMAVEPITADAFSPFGELIEATEDGVAFGDSDADLILNPGTPRFYIMNLGPRPHIVTQITRHRKVTQVLASVGGVAWIIVVAEPSMDESDEGKPDFTALKAFEVPGNVAIKLHRGCWHAGPYFYSDSAQFFNLELSDTNVTDHHSWPLKTYLGFEPELVSTGPS